MTKMIRKEILNFHRFAKNGTVTLQRDYRDDLDEGPLVVPLGKTVHLDLAGYIIDRGRTSATEDGNVITVCGNLQVSDTAPATAHNPAVTRTDPITGQPVTVKGGIITGGRNTGSGGGIWVRCNWIDQSPVTLTLSGGTICGNTSQGTGGGVCLEMFTTFTMTGGAVSGNTAEQEGGGIYGFSVTSLALSGGEITGNASLVNGGGLYMGSESVRLSGSPVISGNKVGTESNNLYLYHDAAVTAGGQLANAVPIGISSSHTPTLSEPVVFTGGLSGKGTAANFVSDNPAYGVRLNGDGEAMLAAKGAIIVQDPTAHGTLTVTTAAPDGSAGASDAACPGDTVTVTLAPNQGWIPGTLIYTFGDEEQTAVTFQRQDGIYTACFLMPVAASVTVAVQEAAFGEANFVLPAETTVIEDGAFRNVAEVRIVDARNCTFIGDAAFADTGIEQILVSKDCEISAAAFGEKTVYVFAEPGGKTQNESCADNPCLIFVPYP